MIVIRNDMKYAIALFEFNGEPVELAPNKTASIQDKDFEYLELENFVVKIKHGVIKIKSMMV
jgi:hypothetical protein